LKKKPTAQSHPNLWQFPEIVNPPYPQRTTDMTKTLLLATFLAAALVACGKKEAPAPEAAPAPAAAPAAAAPAADAAAPAPAAEPAEEKK
jgi:hypothetical protein